MKNYIVINEESYKKLIKELKFYKKQYKNIINRINSNYKGYKQQFLNLKWLENDFKEHSIHYYQLECLVEYLKQLKENE